MKARLLPLLGLLLASDVTGFALGPVVSAILVPSLGLPAPFLVIAGLNEAGDAMVIESWHEGRGLSRTERD